MIKGALIYTRVSTAEQEEGTSLHTQAEAGIAFAAGLNLPVLNVYREVYTGAELFDRPLLTEVRDAIRAGKCSHLIVYAVDRLARNPIHVGILMMEAERAGVNVLFVSEPIDSTPEGALVLYVKGYAAQIEREKIRERCIRGKRQIAVSGRIHRAGTELYGYLRENGKRIIHTPEALIVADIFNRIAVQGDSVRAIARYLNRTGAQPPSIGKRVYKDARTPRWGKSTVTRILREPAYKGEAIAWRWQSKKVAGKQHIIQRPEAEHIRLPEGTVPPIVPGELWEKAQPIDGGGTNKRNETREYLLRGRITCQQCGEAMYAETSKGTRWYRCSSRDKRTGKCGARATRANEAEIFVWEMLNKSLHNTKILRSGIKAAADQTELAKLKAERKTVEQALTANLTAMQKMIRRFGSVESNVLIEAFDRELKTAERAQVQLRDKLEQITGRIEAARGVTLDESKLMAYRAEIGAELATFSFSERVLTLRAFGVSVRAAGKSVQFDLNIRRFVAGEKAITLANCSRNALPKPVICTFKNKFARAA